MKKLTIRRTGDFEFGATVESDETVNGTIRQRGETFLSSLLGLIVLLTAGGVMLWLVSQIGILICGISPFDMDRSPLALMTVLFVSIILSAFAISTAITTRLDPKRFQICFQDHDQANATVAAKPTFKPDVSMYSVVEKNSGNCFLMRKQHEKDVTTVLDIDGMISLVETTAGVELRSLSNEIAFDDNAPRNNIVLQFILRIPYICFVLLSPVQVVRRTSGVESPRAVWLRRHGAFIPFGTTQRKWKSDQCTEVVLVVDDSEQTVSTSSVLALMCAKLF